MSIKSTTRSIPGLFSLTKSHTITDHKCTDAVGLDVFIDFNEKNIFNKSLHEFNRFNLLWPLTESPFLNIHIDWINRCFNLLKKMCLKKKEITCSFWSGYLWFALPVFYVRVLHIKLENSVEKKYLFFKRIISSLWSVKACFNIFLFQKELLKVNFLFIWVFRFIRNLIHTFT